MNGKSLLRLLVVVGLFVGVGAVSRTERAQRFACQQLRNRLPAIVGGPVQIESCSIDLLHLSVRATHVRFERGDVMALSAESLSVSVGLPTLDGLSLGTVHLERPHLEIRILEQLAKAPARRGIAAACPLDALRAFRAHAITIDDGHLHITQADRQLWLHGLKLEASLGSRTSQVSAAARGGQLQLQQAPPLLFGTVAVDGNLDYRARSIDIGRAEATIDAMTMSGQVLIDGLCAQTAPRLDLNAQLYLPLETLRRLGVPLPNPSHGQVAARVTATGPLNRPSTHADIVASNVRIAAFTPGDFSARALFDGSRVVLEEFTTQAGAGSIALSGDIALTAPFPINLSLETRDASFANILARAGGNPHAWVDFPGSAKGTLSGSVLGGLKGNFEVRVGRFAYTNHPADEVRRPSPDINLAFSSAFARLTLMVDREGVTLGDVDLRIGPNDGTHLLGTARFSYDRARFLEVSASFDRLDLADFGSIAGLPVAGVGTGHATLSVHNTIPSLNGTLVLRNVAIAGYTLGHVRGPIHYNGSVLSFPDLTGRIGKSDYRGMFELKLGEVHPYLRTEVSTRGGRVEDLVDLLADVTPVIASVQGGILTGAADASAHFDGPTNALNGAVTVAASGVELLDRRMGKGTFALELREGSDFTLAPVAMVGPLGDSYARGQWNLEGPVALDLGIPSGAVAELLDPKGTLGLPLGGRFAFKAQLRGTASTPILTGTLDSADITLNGRTIAPTQLQGTWTNSRFSGFGTFAEGATGSIQIRTADAWPYAAKLDFDFPNLSTYLPESLKELSGRARGTLTASGSYRTLAKSKATIVLDEMEVVRGDASAASLGTVTVDYDNGTVRIKPVVFRGAATELALDGVWGPAGIDMRARGSLDLRLLAPASSAIDRAQGLLEFSAAVAGTAANPTLSGTAQLRGGGAIIRDAKLRLRDVSASVEFSGAGVDVRSLEGTANEGTFKGRGNLQLDGLAPKSGMLEGDFSEVAYDLMPEVSGLFSGSLTAKSDDLKLWQVAGSIDVDKLVYAKQLQLEGLLATAKRGGLGNEKPSPRANFNVEVKLSGDVRISNNLARAKLGGALKVTGTDVDPVLTGTVETAEGAQVYFRSNTFAVSRGQLQFNGLWPTLDFTAQSRIRDYAVDVKAYGRLSDPKVSLSSEPALSETDIVSLVTVGLVSRDRLSGQAGVGVAAGALYSASGLDAQVQRFLARNIGFKDQQLYITTAYNDSTGTVEPAVAWESKIATDNIKVGLIQPVTGRGTKAQLDYFITPRASARIQWDNQTITTSYGNPGLEFRFRFEWD